MQQGAQRNKTPSDQKSKNCVGSAFKKLARQTLLKILGKHLLSAE
jgi:hypothetical protein